MTESLIVVDCVVVKGLTCKKLWLAMMRASWAPSSSGWAWLLLIPCTNWGMQSATACNKNTTIIYASYPHHHVWKRKVLPRLPNRTFSWQVFSAHYLTYFFNTSVKREYDHTLQLCTSCWCDTVFLLEAAAFWAAAMVWVAAAAACLAAICSGDTNGNHLG